MADEKKPKIDLKARLGKTQIGVQAPTPTPGVPAGIPAPQTGNSNPPSSPRSVPPPGGVLPVPPGVPIGASPFAPPQPTHRPPGIDPSNPLAAVAMPRSIAPAAPVQPQPQRIEIDEGAIEQARGAARKQGLIIGIVIAAALGGVGYVAGGASEKGAAHEVSKKDAADLKADIAKAKESLKALADKIEAGRNQLSKEHKFPADLSKDLGGINVAFDGTELSGRHFGAISKDTTQGIVQFITSVQELNDRKAAVQSLLTRLQKPLTEQLNAPPGQKNVSYVVAVDKDANGPFALLAPLTAPIPVTQSAFKLPDEFNFTVDGSNTKLARYTGGDITTKPGAIYVVPKSFDNVCPSATAGAAVQLAAQIGNLLHDINGDPAAAAGQEIVDDRKPGLLERADTLSKELEKVQ